MKKSYLLISLILVMILAVSAVSAADNDVTSDLAESQVSDEVVSTPAEDPVVTATDDPVSVEATPDSEVLKDPGDKNFTVLQQEIDDSPYGMINLNSNYVRQDGENDIVISKTFNIFGNDQYKIDANGLGGIFKINEGCAVVLNNVILVNGNNENGGTIYNEGTVSIISSQISNSNSDVGGAIYNKGIASISGSTLNGNTATTKGGAVYSEGTIVIDGSTFDNNKVTTGDSYSQSLTDCNGGGAIYNQGNLRVTGSTFSKNTAPHAQEVFSSGGAIYNKDDGTLLIDNCKFEENSAVYGGAIMFEEFSQDTVAIKDSVFNGNQAWQGGAINGNDLVGSLIVTGSNFTANKAVTPNAGQSLPCGGAFMIGTKSYTGIALDVSDCNFEDNEAVYMGGAIASSPNNVIKVTNSNFTNNSAAMLGGAIITGTGTKLTVTGSNFIDNKATDTDNGMGGAIFAEPGSESTITDSTFTGNVDRYPVAIMNYQGTLELSGNTFDDNSVFNYGTVTSQINVEVLDNDTVSVYDGNVNLKATVTDDNGNFIRDSSFKFLINGEQVAATIDVTNKIYTATYTIPNAGVYSVTATSTKGEEYIVKNGTVKNYKGTFTDLNQKITDAQGTLDLTYNFKYSPELGDEGITTILISNDLIINGNGFTISASSASINIFRINSGVTATLNNTILTGVNGLNSLNGGAVLNLGDLTVDNCTFIDNAINRVSNGNGGAAIFSVGTSSLTITDSKFINNTAPWSGSTGAVSFWSTGTVLIKDSYFERNVARFGGAVEFENLNQQSVAIDNCTFYNNTGYQGGAVDVNDGAKYVNITGSTFDSNNFEGPAGVPTTGAQGAAICVGYNVPVTLEISNSIIKNNYGDGTTPSSGAGIRLTNYASGIIKNCTFENNYGADYAAISAGTFDALPGSLAVDNCTFINNDAPNGISVFANENVVSTIENCDFSADTNEIAIANRGTLTLKNNTISKTSAKIINNGEITSTIEGKVLNGTTPVYADSENVEIYAVVTDDSGNLVNDTNFVFKIYDDNDQLVKTIAAAFDGEKYVNTTVLAKGYYTVKMNNSKYSTDEIEDGKLAYVVGTYTDLKARIDALGEGETLTLPYDFEYTPGIDDLLIEGVVISKPITINGNGHTISGNNTARILSINANAETTLNNINFVKGYYSKSSSSYGAAIKTSSVLTVDGCNFTDNHISGSNSACGGAIYSAGSLNLTILNSNFDNNTAAQGAAVHLNTGANLTVVNCNFTNNKATGENYGGAIYYKGGGSNGRVVSISDSKFINNTVSATNNYPGGGALYLDTAYNATITNSEFIGNNATNGGAIYYGFGVKKIVSNLTIDGCNFTNNSATGNGEAIYFYIGGKNGNISTDLKGSRFTNNGAADEYAIYSLTPYKSVAIALEGNTIDNIIYNAGTITSKVNAVVLNNKTYETAEDSYVLNATLTDDNGNKIYDPNLKFKVNDDEAVAFTSYENGVYTYDAYAIGFEPKYVVNVTSTGEEKLNVKTGIIKNLKAGTYTDLAAKIADAIANNEGVLDLPYDFEYTEAIDGANFPQGVVITQDIIINGNGYTISANDASVNIFTINGGAATLSNITFTGVNGDTSLKYGAVVNHASLTIDNCTFIDNKISKVSNANGGAAVFNDGNKLLITDSIFINNTAPWSGSTGAVSSWSTSNVLIKDSYFERNVARFGGAVEFENLNQQSVAVDNCTFFNNTGYQGGALDINDGARYVNITGSTFDSNTFRGPAGAPTTGANGAAISAGLNVPLTVEISNSIIKNNEGDGTEHSSGAGIRLADHASGIITNCTFESNVATGGSALDVGTSSGLTGTLTLKDSRFNNNVASYNSPVYLNKGITASIDNCTFAGNTAKYDVYNNGILDLNSNTLPNGVRNNGTITSTTNVTVLGNRAVNAKYGQTVILNATYTDDNGNLIYDPNLTFTVEGDEAAIPSTYDDGLYTAEYKISMRGEKAVTARLPYDVDTYNGLLDIGPATVILTIDANETIMRKQNETITIKLVDEFGNLLNLSLPVVVQNSAEEDVFSETITTQNGTYTFNLTGLGVDTYTITAVFSNDNYVPNPKIVFKPFEVTPLEINGTYTDLQKQIDETLENGVLVLPYDFAYYDFVDEDFFPYGVIINKNITIDGNGSTISGSKVYRIFNITAGNVVFNNITFVDGIADNGGAIYANSTEDITVTILNSTFANNTATIGGGAVAFMSDDDSKVTYYIIDSLFENNTASGTYNEDESVAGGAVYSEGITDWCYIGSTTFKNNKAIEGNMPNGGAVKVQFGGQLVVLNSTFEDNFAEQAGGAISVQSNTNMNCTVIVLNTKFENNKAGQAGAAVSAIETSGNSLVVIINSTLENNVADITAHAVYVSPRSSVGIINTTLTGNGGATDYGIYNLGKLALMNNTISNIVYTNSVYGGGIISTDTYARILENQTFDITSDRYTLVTTLTDDNGNKIYDCNLEFTINGVPIDAVLDYDKESGLYTYVFEIGSERIYVVNVTSDNEKKLNTEVGILRFINGTYTDLLNKINDAEGTLVLPYNFTYTAEIDGDKFPSGVVINKSITIDGNGSTISGNNSYRIFYIASNNVNLTNITFTKGNASGKWGGAIYVNGDYENLTVSDSKFTQNSAGVNGGAIYWAGDKGKLLSSMFMNNTAGASGGAVFWFGDDGYIGNGSSFMMNNATENGGAVAWFTNGAVGGHNGVIDNSTFMMNSAGQNGGAVFWQSPDGTLKNSRFMFMNSATQNGGAVFWFAENGVIDNSSFMMNSINGDLGGALFSQGENLTIKDSSFTMNFAANGGAVALLAKATIDNSTFTFLNSAKNYGGAIFIDSDVSISNSTIAYNNATIGKGIYVNSGKLSLQNNTINNASADIVLSSNAVIVSYVNATILGNTTVDTTGLTVNLTANITDDRGNLIEAPNFKFVINGEEVAAAYNATSKLYEAEYTLPGVGVYPVDMTYTETENLDTYIGIIRNIKGTYTDLQNLINDADGELILPYDFIYTEEIDGEKFPEGVLIESPIVIEGNGYTISGNNSYRIFRITADTTINNVTFTNGSAVEFGGAIYTTADLTVSNSTFVNNSVALNDANGGAIAAIADGSEITLNVNNVLFENNCVDNAGGAIAVATMDSKVNYNIYYSEFVDNYAYEAIAASGGAIFSYGNTEGLINNTVFRRNYIDCEDLSNGGAIKLQFGGKLTVANSTFEDNEAEYTGSAISVQADDGKNNVLIVDNCTFTGNSASYGDTITSKQYAGESVVIIKGSTFDSGIFLDELTKASISNSTIENEGYHGIYNLGLLILDKNVVDIIYNNGTILSSVNATLLGNETVPAELYDEVYPFATLTDDNENPIYDPNFRITVNDVVIEDVEYDYDEKIYVSNYTIVKPGDYVVSTLYAADIYTGIYQVPKANITRFEVIPGGQDNRIPYGENVTVYVVLEGVDGEGLNETFNVIVNNAEYSVTVTNGSGSFNVSGLAPGQYAALGIFPGNDCYNKAYATGVFSVLEPEAKLTIEIADITVGEVLVIKVNLTDAEGNPIFGTVVVEIQNASYSIVVYGNGSFAISDVPAGNYTAVAASIADASHASVNNTTDFEVKKISDYDFIATAGTGYEYGETVEVDVFLPENAAGNVTITINDTSYSATVENGQATIEIPGLAIGDYEDVEVLYSGDDNYNPGTTNVTIYVLPADPEFDAYADYTFISYGENATIIIEINENATGIISVYSYDYEAEESTFLFNVTVEKAREGISIGDLNIGENFFDLVYSGDTIFAEDEASAWVTVEKAVIDWSIEPDYDVIIDVNDTVNVKLVNVTEGAEGNITITIDGFEYGTYTLEEALAGINITEFDTPGTYTVEVAFIENPNYEYTPSSLSFDVTVDTIDADMNVTVPEDAKVGDTVNITVELPEDASGELAVIVDGVEVANVDVEGGKVIVPVEDLAAGEHNVVVIYSGDDKYDTAKEETVLNVSKVDPTIEIEVDGDGVVGGSAHVTVTLPDDATDYVLVDVNGMQYFGELEEGVYSFDIDDLEALTYDIEVTYVGDDKYNKATKSANFTVGKSNATIDAILPGEVTADEIFTVYVTVDPADATGNFSVFIDGVDVSDEYSGLTIIDGEGSFTILGLTAGNHTIGVRYNGDLNYNASEIKTYDINVTKVDVSGDIKIIGDDITYGETAIVSFMLLGDSTGNVTVIVNGVEYTVPLDDDGCAVVEIPGLDAGLYEDLQALYSGDDKYAPYEGVITIEVAPFDVDWGMEPDEDQFIDVNDTVTVKLVDVTEGAEGNITITIDGVEYGNYTLVEALAGIELTGFDTPGTYTVEVGFIENPNYEYAPSLIFDVIVDTIDADMNVTVPEDAKVGDTVNITVELPEDAAGEVAVFIDGVEVASVDVEGGKVIVPVEDLAAGEHNVVVIYSGDDKYDTATGETVLNVSKVDPTIEIAVDGDGVVGGSAHVTVTLPDDATNYVLVDVNGMQYFGELEEGVYSFDIDDLEALTYDIEVTYVGDDKYNKATKSANFTVGKSNATIDAMVPGEVTVDEIFTVYVTVDPADATGNFSVFIDGIDVSDEYTVTITDGEGSFDVYGLTAGNHTIGVRYNGDLNYNASEIKTYDINVTKVDVSGDIEIYDVYITYGEVACVVFELLGDATGNVTVIVNGVEYTAPLDDGSAVVEIPGLDAGLYEDLQALYSGDDKYAPYEGVVTIEVAPFDVDWGMEPDEDQFIDVNDTVTVKLVDVTEGAEGNITITIDGVEYGNYTLEEALAGIELTGFDTPGTYTVEVGFIENPNYEYAESLVFDVIVDTIEPDMNVTVPEDAKVGDTVNITVELPEDAAGEVTVFIDGVEVASVDVEGGKVIVPVDDLAAGEHNVVVIYSGDDTYDTATEETVLNVSKVDPTIRFDVKGDDVVGGSVEVTVSLPEDATGYVLIDVNGMQYFGELVDGAYSFDIDDLQAIEYEIDVTYVGDDKYNKATGSANLTVRKALSDIEANLPGEADVGDFVVVEVTVDPAAATGNYSVFIDGVDVSEQFADLNIANGKGSFVIPGLTNGTHTIGVRYNGDSNYEPSGTVEYQIVINKVDVSGDIHIEGSEITYTETATVTFELPDDATGTVTVIINGEEHTADVDGGIAVVEISGLDADIYENVVAKYSGDDKYEAYEGNATIEVEPLFVDWFLDNDDIYIDVNETVFLNIYDVSEGGDGLINVTVNGEEFGVYSLGQALAGIEIDVFNAPGEYTVVFAFVDNPNFEYASPVDVLVIVRTIDADMNVTLPSDVEAGSPSEVTVELPSDATGNVTVIVDGKEVATAPVEDGKATVEVPGLTAGNHTVDVVYSGDDTYSPAIVSDNLTVSKADATVVGEADDITIGEDATIIITVPSDAKGVVLVDIDGQSLYGNIVDGKATVTVSGLTAGEKTATITLTSDDKYAETSNTTTFTVNKVKEYDMSVNSTTPREGENATVTVELPSDANGNVTVTDSNGNSVTVPVENGKATVEVPGLTEGENNVTVTYSGDDKYDSKSENATVNVKPALINTVLSAEKLEMYVGDGSKFQAKLVDEDGNPVANRGIKVTICGKTYTIKTNSSGIAVLPINLKAGSYPTTLVFNGDSQYNASNVVSTSVEVYTKVRITDNKDLVKTYGGSEKFTVRALDKYGKPVGAYAKVKMTIAGKTYTVNTDSNGYASLPINLKAGTYPITTEYGGTTVKNTVTVKSK